MLFRGHCGKQGHLVQGVGVFVLPQERLGRGSCSNSLPLKAVVLQTCPPRVWLKALAKAFRGHLSRNTSGGLAQAPLEKNRKAPLGVNSPQVNSLSLPPMQGGGTGPRAKVQHLSQNGYAIPISLSLSLALPLALPLPLSAVASSRVSPPKLPSFIVTSRDVGKTTFTTQVLEHHCARADEWHKYDVKLPPSL